ncbi:MAG: hypothetical protein ACE5JO_12125, partial [Candidatus Binatia bacterium]
MDFPRALVVLSLSSVFYLLIQFYLFYRIRDYLYSRIQDGKQQRLLSGLAASFFILMLFPLAWRILSALHIYEPYPWGVRGLFTVSAVWIFGSSGLTVILLGYDFFQRFFHRGFPRP